MTPRERMDLVLACQKADRIPFAPAIYEHKAFLLNKTPSEVGRNEDLIVQAILKEYEFYRPDFLTVGLDVYNVEAEALGCSIKYYDDSPDVPGVARHLCDGIDEVRAVKPADPETAGRMPIFLRAAERVHAKLGREIYIRGAVSGPFSLASELIGFENLLIATSEDPEIVGAALETAVRAIGDFAEAFLKRGIGVIIFDSRAMPPLTSPDIFEGQILPHYQTLTARLKKAGAAHLPVIIGGDTTSIAELLTRTGATQFLCDFDADFETWRQACAAVKAPFRANIDARVVHRGKPPEVVELARQILAQGQDVPGFILGTGVCGYDTNPENIHGVRRLVAPD
ncbi:MAG: hypothetical protein KIS92_23750 [Planctomycetota bacterium]|nr:hypothetical protein [Planctomycetota bacterium]